MRSEEKSQQTDRECRTSAVRAEKENCFCGFPFLYLVFRGNFWQKIKQTLKFAYCGHPFLLVK